MKVYNNQFTKKILIGMTAITLMTSSHVQAHAINEISEPVTNFKYYSSINYDSVTHENFNFLYNTVLNNIGILKNISVPFSHIDQNRHSNYMSDYNVGPKILLYFANYNYIKNTPLETILREQKIIDTYLDIESFGLNLDLNSAHGILLDLLTYNFQTFNKIKYDEYEFILSRDFNVKNLSSLINPAIFLVNENDKKIVDMQFKNLLNLIKYCNNNDKENIKKCLHEYFYMQVSDNNISAGAKWLNNVTNNGMCIKIIETYLINNYNKKELESLFGSIDSANLYFQADKPLECCEEYTTKNIYFDNITDPFLKLLLECDKKLHTDYYCNTDKHLLDSINLSLKKDKSKII